jgi:ubiquinone/menaquinone biosynthesis C-methylase UbiE
MRQLLIKLLKLTGLYSTLEVPAYIKKNYISIDEGKREQLIQSVLVNHKVDLKEDGLKHTADDYLFGRLENFRGRHIFFLDSLLGLKGKKILEIGCGNGGSSVALAEQGAEVFGLDVDESSLALAADRAAVYGLSDKIFLKNGNAEVLDKLYEHNSFDVVIFFASIEHMTYDERINSLKAAWTVLKKGGALCILGTPNRLWFFDMHTSLLPFYYWLPDEIAFKYTSFSSREFFNKLHERDYKATMEEFARWGRGVSYHEVELAIKPVGQLNVIGDLHSFERPKTILQKLAYRLTDEYKFKNVLAKHGPATIHPGFYEYYLDVAILKD